MKKTNNSIVTNHYNEDGTPIIININSMAEMKQYYTQEHNQYWFNDSVKFNCDIDIKASIWAENIEGNNITCEMLRTWGEINADNIKAELIECEELHANKVDCNTLKNASRVEVEQLNARIVRKCGYIQTKSVNSVVIECDCLDAEEGFIMERVGA